MSPQQRHDPRALQGLVGRGEEQVEHDRLQRENETLERSYTETQQGLQWMLSISFDNAHKGHPDKISADELSVTLVNLGFMSFEPDAVFSLIGN